MPRRSAEYWDISIHSSALGKGRHAVAGFGGYFGESDRLLVTSVPLAR